MELEKVRIIETFKSGVEAENIDVDGDMMIVRCKNGLWVYRVEDMKFKVKKVSIDDEFYQKFGGIMVLVDDSRVIFSTVASTLRESQSLVVFNFETGKREVVIDLRLHRFPLRHVVKVKKDVIATSSFNPHCTRGCESKKQESENYVILWNYRTGKQIKRLAGGQPNHGWIFSVKVIDKFFMFSEIYGDNGDMPFAVRLFVCDKGSLDVIRVIDVEKNGQGRLFYSIHSCHCYGTIGSKCIFGGEFLQMRIVDLENGNVEKNETIPIPNRTIPWKENVACVIKSDENNRIFFLSTERNDTSKVLSNDVERYAKKVLHFSKGIEKVFRLGQYVVVVDNDSVIHLIG